MSVVDPLEQVIGTSWTLPMRVQARAVEAPGAPGAVAGPAASPSLAAVEPSALSVPTASGPGRAGQPGSRLRRAWRPLRRIVGTLLVVAVGLEAVAQRDAIGEAARLLDHLSWVWVTVAGAAEAVSLLAFARLQRLLLRAGGVAVGARQMLAVALAANAIGTSLPGGAAWAASWTFARLRRWGADRALAGWVVLVAGALASFALFAVLAAGIGFGGRGDPLATLRWPVVGLAAIPAAAAVAAGATRRRPLLRARLCRLATSAATRLPGGSRAAPAARQLRGTVRTLRPSGSGWARAFGLALANRLADCVALAACLWAVGTSAPWPGLLAAYALAKVAATLPVTPGGVGVVEATLAALLVGYGVRAGDALATVALYRVVSFWVVVPMGWLAWLALARAGRASAPGPEPECGNDGLPGRGGYPSRSLSAWSSSSRAGGRWSPKRA
ncbi:MAG: lysylphosphatidylglycerol synthase transmembrane domain-containing protein [Acidimicrobiales bacterium]